MANPQAELGHTDIANDIMEALAKLHLAPSEWMVLMALLRKTYGWHKRQDRISVTQFQQLTGLERRPAHRAIKRLLARGVIHRIILKGNHFYSFQKNYDSWLALPKSATPTSVAKNCNDALPKTATLALPKIAPTKEKKETIQKKGRTDNKIKSQFGDGWE